MRTRWLSLLPLVVLVAACSVPESDPASEVGDDDVHNLVDETSPDEPLPGLPGEETASTYEAPLSGGGCVAGGSYCGGDKVSGDHGTLYLCHGKATPTVIKHCADGCSVNPGKDDSCSPAPSSCAIIDSPHASYLKWGLHPDASDALRHLNVSAARVMQTIGNASASAGTHGQDGVAGGHAYSAATDLSVSGMSDAQIRVFLQQLTSVGFAAYYRSPGHDGWPSSEVRHIHAIWVGAKMKLSLRNQIRDWHVGKNGLASHGSYSFYTWTSCWHSSLWQSYLKNNSASN